MMKRDMNLVREILLAAEKLPAGSTGNKIEISGYTTTGITYHVFIMSQAGLLFFWPPTREIREDPHSSVSLGEMMAGSYGIKVIGLTWQGQEHLDTLRSPKLFERAKEEIGKKAIGVPFEVVTHVIREALNSIRLTL
jgi:hypothetical protein